MVLAVALGIAVCTMTFTIYHAMATNPIEWKSDELYAVTMDTWDPDEPYDKKSPDVPPLLMTYRDATALHTSDIPKRSAVMYKSGAVLDSGRAGAKPFRAILRATTGEFFPMFDVAVSVRQRLGQGGGRRRRAGHRAERRDEPQDLRRREQRGPHRARRRRRTSASSVS